MFVRDGRSGVADNADIIGGDQMTYAGVERVNVWNLAAGCIYDERRPTTLAIFQLLHFIASSKTRTTIDSVGSKKGEQGQRHYEGRT